MVDKFDDGTEYQESAYDEFYDAQTQDTYQYDEYELGYGTETINTYEQEYSDAQVDTYNQQYDEEHIDEYEQENLYNTSPTKRDKIIRILLDIMYEAEIYQGVGAIGAIIILIGSFCPLVEISFFGETEKVSYLDSNGIIIILLAFSIILLIIVNKHKYTIIPAIVALALNISVQMGLLIISDYVVYKSGYYLVWIGGTIVIISSFLINYGYAKDSAFRKNSPLYFRDAVWAGFVILGAILLTNVSDDGSVSSLYTEKIEQLEEAVENNNVRITDDNKNDVDTNNRVKKEFDNKIYFEKPEGWGDTIYAYTYLIVGQNSEEMSKWPGKKIKEISNGVYSFGYDDYWLKGFILFTDGSNQIPAYGESGIKLQEYKKIIGKLNDDGTYSYEGK